MSKPKSTKFRGGGRNREFFHGLSGLANALDNVCSSMGRASQSAQAFTAAEKLAEANEKRRAKAERRLRQAERGSK
jgi:hypothetical protein